MVKRVILFCNLEASASERTEQRELILILRQMRDKFQVSYQVIPRREPVCGVSDPDSLIGNTRLKVGNDFYDGVDAIRAFLGDWAAHSCLELWLERILADGTVRTNLRALPDAAFRVRMDAEKRLCLEYGEDAVPVDCVLSVIRMPGLAAILSCMGIGERFAQVQEALRMLLRPMVPA